MSGILQTQNEFSTTQNECVTSDEINQILLHHQHVENECTKMSVCMKTGIMHLLHLRMSCDSHYAGFPHVKFRFVDCSDFE